MRVLSILFGFFLAILAPATCVAAFVFLYAYGGVGDGIFEKIGGFVVMLVISSATIAIPVLLLSLVFFIP